MCKMVSRLLSNNMAEICHYENTPIQIYWEFFHQKWNFSDKKKSDIFLISAQNIDCGYSLEPPRWGGSNEYPQSMFFSKNKKINAYPGNPSFTKKKWGLRGSKLYRYVFVMANIRCAVNVQEWWLFGSVRCAVKYQDSLVLVKILCKIYLWAHRWTKWTSL